MFLPRSRPFFAFSVVDIRTVAPRAASDGGDGLGGGAIAGIVAGLVVLLLLMIAAVYFLVRYLRQPAHAPTAPTAHRPRTWGHRRGGASGGTGGSSGSAGHAKRPSRTLARLAYDDLMERGTDAGTVRGAATDTADTLRGSGGGGRHSRFHSEDIPRPTSALSALSNAPTAGGDSPDAWDGSVEDLSSQEPPHVHNTPGHQRWSGSTAGAQHGPRGSYMSDGGRAEAAELGTDGGFVPELPGSGAQVAPGPATPGYAARPRAISAVSAASAASIASVSTWGEAESAGLGRHARGNSGSSARRPAGPRLGAVAEAVAEQMHGHYGPTDVAAGQTTAGGSRATGVP